MAPEDEIDYDPSQTKEETPLKPKRTRTITAEQKQILSERMRKVNEDRIAKAKIANETILQEKEARVKQRLETLQKKKEQIKELKAKSETAAPIPPVPTSLKAEKPKKTKKVVLPVSSSDDDDDESSEEEEVVYVAKSKKSKAKSVPLTKTKSSVAQVAQPTSVFKFV